MTTQFWLFLFASVAIGYGAGWFGPMLPLPRWARRIILGLLPFWVYLGFMLTVESTASVREDVVWFGVGLMMVSPFIVSWIGAYAIAAYVRRKRVALGVDKRLGES